MDAKSSGWQIENLVKSAFIRTKERFLSYFLALLVNGGIMIVILAAFLIIGAALYFAYSLTNSFILGIILGAVFLVFFLAVWFYIGSWLQLTLVQIIIQDQKKGAIETLKETKPLAWEYFKFNLLVALFIWGLFVFGLLSLGIIFVLWAFWSMFIAFAYLRQRKKGLDNLWVSKQMIGQKFWGIVWRMMLINIAILLLQVGVGFDDRYGGIVATVISLLSGPFVIAYTYEMYKNLQVPEAVKKPKIWIILSVIGWILLAVVIFITFSYLSSLLPSLKIPSSSNFSTI